MLFRRLLFTLLASSNAISLQAYAAQVSLKQLTNTIYIAEDTHYIKENSVVYIGDKEITVIGATWTPTTAEELATEIRKVSNKPITTVIDPDYHADRSGGNAYWKSIGAKVVSTQLTYDELKKTWPNHIKSVREYLHTYPLLPLVLPDVVHPGNFELQNGKIQVIYLGPSHTKDSNFVYFPTEKVLYGNCILKEQLGNLTDGDVNEYPKTLTKLKNLKLDIKTIISGHGNPIHGPELIDHYLTLLKEHSSQSK